MELKIAVCDDEDEQRRYLSEIISDWASWVETNTERCLPARFCTAFSSTGQSLSPSTGIAEDRHKRRRMKV